MNLANVKSANNGLRFVGFNQDASRLRFELSHVFYSIESMQIVSPAVWRMAFEFTIQIHYVKPNGKVPTNNEHIPIDTCEIR
jgi:hypothetical protein